MDELPLHRVFRQIADRHPRLRNRPAHDPANMRRQIQRFPAGTRVEPHQAFSREQIGFYRTDYGAENQDKLKPVRHRLVRFDPRTGRKSLYLSAHIGGIVGWPVPEARMAIRDLTEHAVQRQFVHAHAWKSGDLTIWDNRTTMHRARRYNDLSDVRDMRRTTIRGDGVTVAQIQQAA